MSTSVRVLFSSALPGTRALPTSSSRQTRSAGEGEVRAWRWCTRGARVSTSPNRTRRSASGSRARWPPEDLVDGDDVGGDDQPDPGVAGPPGRAAGHRGGDGSRRRTTGGRSTTSWRPTSRCCWSTPASVKNVPGRKTDVSDAAWLADLGAHGLLRASFVPPEPIRQLRDLTRARTHITQGPDPGDPAVGEAAGSRRDQTVLGGHRHHRVSRAG